MGARLLDSEKKLVGDLSAGSVIRNKEVKATVWGLGDGILVERKRMSPLHVKEKYGEGFGNLWPITVSGKQIMELQRMMGWRTSEVKLKPGEYLVQPDGERGFASYPKTKTG